MYGNRDFNVMVMRDPGSSLVFYQFLLVFESHEQYHLSVFLYRISRNISMRVENVFCFTSYFPVGCLFTFVLFSEKCIELPVVQRESCINLLDFYMNKNVQVSNRVLVSGLQQNSDFGLLWSY